MSVVEKVYHKKHFYKVTWERSDVLLREVPWLKDERHEFCMVGYREPTPAEAERFIGDVMFDRLFDTVSSVQEISKEEALRDFQMDNWRSQKVFGADEIHRFRSSLADRLLDATARAEKQAPGGRDIDRDYLGY